VVLSGVYCPPYPGHKVAKQVKLTNKKFCSSVRAHENFFRVEETSSSPTKYFIRLSIPPTKELETKYNHVDLDSKTFIGPRNN